MAAQIRRELQTEVEMVRGRYGLFRVTVGGETVIDGGAAAFLGLLPPGDEVVATIKAHLAQ